MKIIEDAEKDAEQQREAAEQGRRSSSARAAEREAAEIREKAQPRTPAGPRGARGAARPARGQRSRRRLTQRPDRRRITSEPGSGGDGLGRVRGTCATPDRSGPPTRSATSWRAARPAAGAAPCRTRSGGGPPCGRCTTGTTRRRSPTCAARPANAAARDRGSRPRVPQYWQRWPSRANTARRDSGAVARNGTRTKCTRRMTVGTGTLRRSERNSAPLRCTISAFSFSTSTTARRDDTTQSGSKLALSNSARATDDHLRCGRDVPGIVPTPPGRASHRCTGSAAARHHSR